MTKARDLANNVSVPPSSHTALKVLNVPGAALEKYNLTRQGTGATNVTQGFTVDPYTGELFTSHKTSDSLVVNKFDSTGAVSQTASRWNSIPSQSLGTQQLDVSWDKDGNRWFWTSAPPSQSGQAKYIKRFKIADGASTTLALTNFQMYQVYTDAEVANGSGGQCTASVSLDGRYLVTEYSGSYTKLIKVFNLQDVMDSGTDISTSQEYSFTIGFNSVQRPLQGIACDGAYVYTFAGNIDPSDSSTANTLQVYVHSVDGTLVQFYDDFEVGLTEAQSDGAGTKYEFEGAGWTWHNGTPHLSIMIVSGNSGARVSRIWALGAKAADNSISSGGVKQAITGVITNGNANQTTSTFKSSTEAGGSGDVALTITPTATGSKLLVGIQCSMSSTTANKTGEVAIYRGTTQIAKKGIIYQNIGQNINTGFYIECLDEPTIPETPTPITYTLKFACAQNNAQVNIHAESGDPARVTILEIAS